MKMKGRRALLFVVCLSLFATFAIAQPYGPNEIQRGQNERANLTGQSPVQVDAQAGNVTELTINATIITDRWQGYYGNITGVITLDDADQNTLYDWTAGTSFSPIGEIYAANQSVTNWDLVFCFNFTNVGLANGQINLSDIESQYGMSSGEGDGVDETFTTTNNITIGTTTLLGCPATNLYQNNASQSVTWNETLLYENVTNTVIFASEVAQDTVGFNGLQWDFQMIVAEDGDVAGSTPYQFYVELT